VDPAIVDLARDHRLVVCIEDNGSVGGCGSVLLQTAQRRAGDTPFRLHGIPQEFLDHAKRASILERIGLTAQTIARRTVEDISRARRRDGTQTPRPTRLSRAAGGPRGRGRG
jgi:1-deoxy-D-xylulose-5-phosphate synthase